MSRSQRMTLVILVLAIILVCGGLSYFVGQDVLTYQIAPLASNIQAARMTPPPPTVVLVWPTITPTLAISQSVSSADQAIAFVQNFRYTPDQEKTLLSLISTVQAASEKLGHTIKVEGWWAEDRTQNRWVVAYSYWENSTPKTYKFAVNLDSHEIRGDNDDGTTALTFLQQEAHADRAEPTPTAVAIFTGWATRDYFTKWEYSVPNAPEALKTVGSASQAIRSENGFQAIPLTLRNIDTVDQTIGSEYYIRFALKDSAGKTAGVVSQDGLFRPTRLYARSQGRPEFTAQPVTVSPGKTLNTALVFRLLPNTTPPYTLEITVYDKNQPHHYEIKLAAS